MPKRNWWRRLCHDFLSRSRRASRPNRFQPRFEPLENRLAPAVNLSNVVAQISNPTPVAGEWVTVSVTYDTEGITSGGSEGESYGIEFRLNGTVYLFNNVTLGRDQGGVVNQTFNLSPGFWSVEPGTNTLEVILDPNNDLLETDDVGDNSNTLTFSSTAPTLTEKLILPTAPEQASITAVVHYMDTMPGGSSQAKDYRGGSFTFNEVDGIDIYSGNFTQMDAGLPLYAAAGGTVTAVVDSNFDRNDGPTGPNNFITIDHGNGWSTIYNNLLADSSAVQIGDVVTQGQLIALMGSSGVSNEVHTRFQLRYNGSTVVDPFQDVANYFVDPAPVYQGDLTPYVLDSGISNYNGDHKERTSSKTVFSTAETNDVVFWTRFAHLKAGDQLNFRWFRPDGSLHVQFNDNISQLEQNSMHVWSLNSANWSVYQGTWEVSVSLAGKELARHSFDVVDPSGAVPEILVRDSSSDLLPSGRTTPIDFGTIALGGTAPTHTFSIQNHSSADLEVTGIVLPPGFSLVTGVPVTVAANSIAAFTVQLDTAVVGAKFGAIQLFTNDADEGTYTFNVKGTVTGTADANAPVITLPGPAIVYQVGSTPTAVNPGATVTDADSVNFGGGQILIEFAAGGQAGDRLTILDSPTGPGPGVISLNGSDVEYEGFVVGTFVPGTSITPLTIDLNSSATLAAVEAIVRAAAYSNVDFLSTTPRYVRFTVIDDTGKTSNLPIQVILTDLKAVLPGVITGVPFSGEQVVISSSTSVRSVVAGDINGDGDIDFVSASFGNDQINWYDKNGSVYTRRTVSTTANGAHSVFLADLDGDGDLDILSASFLDDKIAWYENNGGSFTLNAVNTISTAAVGATSVFAADVDGDGDMDVLSASYTDNKIAWYENDGAADPTFSAEIVVSSSANGARSVVAADLDRDGDMDIASASYLDDKIAWYQNDGAVDPSFTARLVSTVADGATSVAVGDIDGDGDKDLISASANDDKIAWYRNSGTATPSFTLQTVSLNADGAQGVTAADIDGDGDLDIAAASRNDDSVRWYENNGQQDFTERLIWAAADGAFAVTTADIDLDGDIDVIAASATDNTLAYFRNDTIHRSALVNTTAGVNNGADGAFFITTADVDRDGDLDILSASLHDDKIAWYRNDGNGSYSPRIVSTSANGATAVAAADIDGDGDIDLLSASFYDGKIAWYRNDGAQNFTLITITNPATPAEAAGAISVVAADVDGDGDMDVVAGSFEDDEIAWYENDGAANPTFTRHTVTTLADGVKMIAVADIDRDGDMDIASASYNSNRIDWYQNDGTQNFVRRNITISADGAMSVQLFDMDRDGDIDVLATSEADDTVAWYRNNGGSNPSFSGFSIPTTGDKPRSAVGADMDGDGDMDVVSSSLEDNTIRWHENNGSQTFTEHVINTTALGAISVAAADLDGDGDTDVVSAAYFGDAIAWHENLGGQFALATTSTAPVGITEGQMDDVLKIVMTHKGRSGDSDEELASLDLRFDDGLGASLTTVSANAIIENLFIYRDANGNGTFQSGTDTLVTTVSDLDLILGVQKVTFTDGDVNARVQLGSPATFFVVIELTADAVSQSPSEFRITHLTESTSAGEDRNADLPLRLEFVADFVGTVVDALEAPAITSDDNFTFTVDVLDSFLIETTGGPPPNLFLTGDSLPTGVTFVDNGDGTATLEGMPIGLVAGVYNLIITADNGVDPDAVQNFTLTVDPGVLAQVSFVDQPTNETAGVVITPSVTVQLEDQYGNDIATAGVEIDLALILGTGPLDGTLQKQTDANGMATFDDLSLDLIGTKQLQATSLGLASDDSSTFVIGAATATELVFVQQPTDAVAGVAISPAVTVQLLDEFGNLADQSGVSITLSLNGTGTLGGTTTALTDANGVATFSNLTVNLVGTKSLTATSGSLTADTSDNFIISAAAASTVAFVSQPTDTTAGTNIASVTVQVQDAFGNNISQSTSVTVSLNSGTGPLQGTFTQSTDANGLATFNDLRIDVAGAKTLLASSGMLASDVSDSFTINAAAATNLVIIQQPIDTAAGSTIPSVTVQIRDAFGNNVNQVSGIGISLASGDGTLSGTLTRTTNSSGLATFNDLSINLAGLKTLQVTSTGLGTTNSNQFTINAGAATEVVFVQQPSNAVAGVNIAPAVTARLRDQFGNLVNQAGVTINMALATGIGPLLGDTSAETDANGIATFSDLHVNIAGTKSLQASSTLLTGATSTTFVISPAAAAQLAFGQQPTDTTAGVVISPAVTVQVQDQFGNAVSQSGTSVDLILGGTGALLGTTSQLTNGSGVATFSDLQINIAGLKSLEAQSAGLTGVQSVDFTITAAAASKVVFVQQPTDTDIFVAISPAVTVKLQDQFSNDVDDDNVPITMALASGTGILTGGTPAQLTTNGVATFSNLSLDEGGSKTLQADSASLTSATSSPFFINIPPTQVDFILQPTDTTAGSAIAPVTVQLKDYANANVLLANVSITVSLFSGSGPLLGTFTQLTDANGLATFSDLQINIAGTGKVLRATSSGLTADDSNSFTINAAAATQVVFVQQPTDATAGTVISPDVTVQLRDQFGNDVTTDGVDVVMSLETGAGPLMGTTTRATVSGVATFDDLLFEAAGAKTLRASAGLTDAISSGFTISAAAATQLAFVQQPTNTSTGTIIAPAVTVQLRDQFGNDALGSTNVTVALNSGSGTLLGTLTQATSGTGLATFNNLSIAETGVKSLSADDGSLIGAISNTFNISAPATKVVFVQQPTDAVAGVAIAPAVTVQLQDQFDTNVTQANISITMALVNGSGTLIGTTTQMTDVNGLATFSDLQINVAGGGKNLQASSSGLTSSPASTSFSITAAAASKVVFVQQPTNTVAGANIAPAVTVQLRDGFDNNVTQSGVDIIVSLASGTGSLLGTLTQATDVFGVATFNNLNIQTAGLKSLQATSGSLTAATSSNFTISAAAATQIVFAQQPSDALAGQFIAPAVAVQLLDQFGNNVSQAGRIVNMGLIGSGVLSGTASQLTNAAGVATFGNLSVNLVGGKSLQASSGGLTGATSTGFNISTVADRVEFAQQPVGTTAGLVMAPVTVQLKDQFGNLITQANVAVTLSLIAGNGTLLGTLTQLTNASGLATFADLSMQTSGVKTLRASSSGLLFANSANFMISPAAAVKLGFTKQPVNVRAGVAMPPVIVQLFDQFGNAVAQGGVTVKITLISGGQKQVYSAKTNAAGQAVFRTLTPMRRGPGRLVASSAGLLSTTSRTFQTLVNPNFPWL